MSKEASSGRHASLDERKERAAGRRGRTGQDAPGQDQIREASSIPSTRPKMESPTDAENPDLEVSEEAAAPTMREEQSALSPSEQGGATENAHRFNRKSQDVSSAPESGAADAKLDADAHRQRRNQATSRPGMAKDDPSNAGEEA